MERNRLPCRRSPLRSETAADWMLGDVPDMPNFTPLSPIDTSLPAYDEADLQVRDEDACFTLPHSTI